MERETRLELATYTLARYRSTSWAIPALRSEHFIDFHATVKLKWRSKRLFICFLVVAKPPLYNKPLIAMLKMRQL